MMLIPDAAYRTIVIDPPWPLALSGKRSRAKGGSRESLQYATMTVEEICKLDVGAVAAPDGSMCWVWTTNQHLEAAFQCLRAWGFQYLTTITMVKPSGVGNWFVSRTQHIVVGYRPKLTAVMLKRYEPTVIFADPNAEARKLGVGKAHSWKPASTMAWIATVSAAPRIEIFAREVREGYAGWGNEYQGNANERVDEEGNG